jgi:type II secretion system protein N
MKLKFKLPSRSTTAGVVPKRNFGVLLRKARRYALYGAGLTFVFFLFAWINLPTKAIAWRISHEAKKQGMMLTVDDLSVSPFGSVTLQDVVWTFKPTHPDQASVPFVMEELEIDVSLLSLLIGNLDVDVEGTLDEGSITGNFTRGSDEGKLTLEIEDLPLYSVPKLQQAVNAPVRGLFGLDVDLTLPGNKFENAYGTMQLTCAACTVGDGETKMFVPGARGMLSQGVTVPEFNLGAVVGTLNVDKGEAVMEEFEAKGDDITLKIGGRMLLRDPFQRSRLDLQIKLFVSQELQDENDQIRLMIATSSKTAHMDPPDEGWLGFKLQGSVGRPKFRGIKSKSREQRLREARERREERAAERRRKKAEREAAKKKKEEEQKAKVEEAQAEGAFVPDPNEAREDEQAEATASPATLSPSEAAEQGTASSAAPPSEEDDGTAEEGDGDGDGEAGEEQGGEDGGEGDPAAEGGEAGGDEGGDEGAEPVIVQ